MSITRYEITADGREKLTLDVIHLGGNYRACVVNEDYSTSGDYYIDARSTRWGIPSPALVATLREYTPSPTMRITIAGVDFSLEELMAELQLPTLPEALDLVKKLENAVVVAARYALHADDYEGAKNAALEIMRYGSGAPADAEGIAAAVLLYTPDALGITKPLIHLIHSENVAKPRSAR